MNGFSHRVDVYCPAHRPIAETDGQATHLTPTAFETDRRRDAILQVAGLRVVRFTWRQLTRQPHEVAQTLRALLGEPAGSRRDALRPQHFATMGA